MRKVLASILKKVLKWLDKKPLQQEDLEKLPIGESLAIVHKTTPPEVSEQPGEATQKKKSPVIHYPDKPLRDVIDLMEFPFVALSKDRTNPIIYESTDKTKKVVISGHMGHFLASIYDWDIILVVAGKIQEIINNGSDIPSRKITIPRHELLKALHRQEGKKQQKDLEKSLSRLQLTGINTTINNEDGRHVAGFGFIESWRYSERKSDREAKIVQITLSEWLYELCCAQGSLLKSNKLYFYIKSGLKKFLYRTARKHAGEDGWEFSLEKLYEKSGSEGILSKFKYKLKAAVQKNDLPDYSLKWIDKNGKIYIGFKKRPNIEKLDRIVEKYEENNRYLLEFEEEGTAQ